MFALTREHEQGARSLVHPNASKSARLRRVLMFLLVPSLVALTSAAVFSCAEYQAQRELDQFERERQARVIESALQEEQDEARRAQLEAALEVARRQDNAWWNIGELGAGAVGLLLGIGGTGTAAVRAVRKGVETGRKEGASEGARVVVDSIAEARRLDGSVNAAFENMDEKTKQIVHLILNAAPHVADVVATRRRK